VIKARLILPLWLPYAAAIATGMALLSGVVGMVEITYHYSLEADTAPEMALFGLAFKVTDGAPWAVACALLLGGLVISRLAWRAVGRAWTEIVHALQQRQST